MAGVSTGKDSWKELAGKMPIEQISEICGLSPGTIQRYATDEKISLATELKPWTKDDLEFMENNADKMTGEEIGEKLGRTARAVYGKARRIGLSLKKLGEKHHCSKYSDEDIRLAKLLLDDGELSHQQIADKLEISVRVVSAISAGRRRGLEKCKE